MNTSGVERRLTSEVEIVQSGTVPLRSDDRAENHTTPPTLRSVPTPTSPLSLSRKNKNNAALQLPALNDYPEPEHSSLADLHNCSLKQRTIHFPDDPTSDK